jgi:hypothetical protein
VLATVNLALDKATVVVKSASNVGNANLSKGKRQSHGGKS